MLHIIFLILEILLFTVLILLGLVLLLVVLLLFVPIRYKLYAEKNDNFICKLKASWLGFVFCLKANYDENGLVYRLRSFGGTIVSNQEEFTGDEETRKDETSKTGKKSKADKKSKPGKPKDADETVKTSKSKEVDEALEADEAPQTEIPKMADDAVPDDEESKITSDETVPVNRQFAEDDSEFEEETISFITRIGKVFDRFVLSVKKKIENFIKKFKSLKKKMEQYKKLIHAKTTKQALQVVKINLVKLLKHLNPTKIEGRVTYGTGEPASTGTQLGYLSVLLPLYADKIDITPDFSRKILEGDIFIKGRVRVYNILYYSCKVYFNKYVKRTIAYFKKITGGNN